MAYNVWLSVDTGGTQPVTIPDTEWHITSNLRPMMLAAGLDLRTLEGETAGGLRSRLAGILTALSDRPERFDEFAPEPPENGCYAELLEFVEFLEKICTDHPKAEMNVTW